MGWLQSLVSSGPHTPSSVDGWCEIECPPAGVPVRFWNWGPPAEQHVGDVPHRGQSGPKVVQPTSLSRELPGPFVLWALHPSGSVVSNGATSGVQVAAGEEAHLGDAIASCPPYPTGAAVERRSHWGAQLAPAAKSGRRHRLSPRPALAKQVVEVCLKLMPPGHRRSLWQSSPGALVLSSPH